LDLGAKLKQASSRVANSRSCEIRCWEHAFLEGGLAIGKGGDWVRRVQGRLGVAQCAGRVDWVHPGCVADRTGDRG
jgi:hypothetical protein